MAAVDGLDATVLYATTVVPLDARVLVAEASRAAEVVVEPFYAGTLAPHVNEALAHRPTRLLSIGVPRAVISHDGTREQHDAALGLDVRGFANAC